MSQYDAGDFARTPVSSTPVVIVDLDSTLADTTGRRHLAPTGGNRRTFVGWEPYSMGCPADKPIPGTIRLVNMLCPLNLVFLLSARNECAEERTITWLCENGVDFDRLRLRGPEDELTPSAYKVRVISEWIAEGWNVQLNIDDWMETCQVVTEVTGVPSLTPALANHTPGY